MGQTAAPGRRRNDVAARGRNDNEPREELKELRAYREDRDRYRARRNLYHRRASAGGRQNRAGRGPDRHQRDLRLDGVAGRADAVDEINKAGGFKVGDKTYKLELISLDTRGDPKEATIQLKRLLEQDHARFVFGPFLSNVFVTVLPYAKQVQRQVPVNGWGHAHP